jgi:hypothetical protein
MFSCVHLLSAKLVFVPLSVAGGRVRKRLADSCVCGALEVEVACFFGFFHLKGAPGDALLDYYIGDTRTARDRGLGFVVLLSSCASVVVVGPYR